MSYQITRARARLIKKVRVLLKISTYPMQDKELFYKYMALINKHKQEAARKKLNPVYCADLYFDRYMHARRLKQSYYKSL